MQKSVVHILISVVCFAVVNVFVKLLKEQGFPSHELVLFRSVISISFCIAIIRKLNIPFLGINRKWLLIRGLFGSVALYLFFETLTPLPLAVATTIQYLSPIFTIIFAIFLNQQKVKPLQWVFFSLSFLGIFIMKWEDFVTTETAINWSPILIGLCSAALSGIAYNSIIKCKHTDHPITIVMYFPLVAIPFMLIMCFTSGFLIPHGIEWLYVVLMGVFTQIAQVFMTKALTSEKAAVVIPFKYLGSIFAVSFGIIIFDELLSWITLIGIFVVISGVLINTAFERNQKRLSHKENLSA